MLQYLKFEDFDETVHSFDEECKNKGKLVSKPQGSTLRDPKTRVIQVNDIEFLQDVVTASLFIICAVGNWKGRKPKAWWNILLTSITIYLLKSEKF